MGMKQAYEKKLQARLDQWSAEIDRLKARADEAQADVQVKYYNQVKELRKIQAQANRELTELKASGDHAWEELKAGTEKVWDSLEQAIEAAKARFH